jgi:hypothetical protein
MEILDIEREARLRPEQDRQVDMALGFVRRHKWRILGGTVVVGASIAVWRALRGIPLRQIIAMVSQARDRSQGEVDMALKSGDGTRLFVVSSLALSPRTHSCCVRFYVWLARVAAPMAALVEKPSLFPEYASSSARFDRGG